MRSGGKFHLEFVEARAISCTHIWINVILWHGEIRCTAYFVYNGAHRCYLTLKFRNFRISFGGLTSNKMKQSHHMFALQQKHKILSINRIDCGQFLWCWSMRWEKQRATKIDRQNGTKHQLKLVGPNTLRNKCQCFASLAILLMADINKSNEIQWLRFRVPFERKTNSHNQTYDIDGESQCAFTISEQSMMYQFSRQWFRRFEKRNANATADCCFMAQFHTLFCHLQTSILPCIFSTIFSTYFSINSERIKCFRLRA